MMIWRNCRISNIFCLFVCIFNRESLYDDILSKKRQLPSILHNHFNSCMCKVRKVMFPSIGTPRSQWDSLSKLTSSSTVAGPLERSLRVPLPVPILFSLAGLAPFDLGSSISVNQKARIYIAHFNNNTIQSALHKTHWDIVPKKHFIIYYI